MGFDLRGLNEHDKAICGQISTFESDLASRYAGSGHGHFSSHTEIHIFESDHQAGQLADTLCVTYGLILKHQPERDLSKRVYLSLRGSQGQVSDLACGDLELWRPIHWELGYLALETIIVELDSNRVCELGHLGVPQAHQIDGSRDLGKDVALAAGVLDEDGIVSGVDLVLVGPEGPEEADTLHVCEDPGSRGEPKVRIGQVDGQRAVSLVDWHADGELKSIVCEFLHQGRVCCQFRIGYEVR